MGDHAFTTVGIGSGEGYTVGANNRIKVHRVFGIGIGSRGTIPEFPEPEGDFANIRTSEDKLGGIAFTG